MILVSIVTLNLIGDNTMTDKVFYQQNNIGRVRYAISYYNGKKHPDGSDFYDIKIFSNKKDLEVFRTKLLTEGYTT